MGNADESLRKMVDFHSECDGDGCSVLVPLRQLRALLDEVEQMRAVVEAAQVYALTGSGRQDLFSAVDALRTTKRMT